MYMKRFHQLSIVYICCKFLVTPSFPFSAFPLNKTRTWASGETHSPRRRGSNLLLVGCDVACVSPQKRQPFRGTAFSLEEGK